MITYVEVEPANHSDSDAALPAIQKTKERGCTPKELLAVSLNGSEENELKAKEKETEFIAP